MVELYRHDWENHFVDVVRTATRRLLLCSPYVSSYGCSLVDANIDSHLRDSGQITFITDFSPEAICQGATEPEAVQALAGKVPNFELRHLPRLHAKVYIADTKRAIVTSGNLSAGGLKNNYEYGIGFSNSAQVSMIHDDIVALGELGASIGADDLAAFCEIAREVRTSYRSAKNSITAHAKRRLKGVLRRAEDELIRLRLAGGAMHTVFAESILYLLRSAGPLTTRQLHFRIEALHPDFCDNSIDRVIAGKRFGKKWKHAVRTAQQQLKKRGLVELHGDVWELA